MVAKFDVDKIVAYLEKYKLKLPNLYKWNAKIERLVELETLTDKDVREINGLATYYEKELRLKKIVGKKLNETLELKSDLLSYPNNFCIFKPLKQEIWKYLVVKI